MGLTGGARYKVGHAAAARAFGDRMRGEVIAGEFSRGWPGRLPVCGAALRLGKRVSRGIHGLVTGIPVACTGSRALLGAAGALGLEPGCPLKGRMRVFSGRCLSPGLWSLGCRDGPSFVLPQPGYAISAAHVAGLVRHLPVFR